MESYLTPPPSSPADVHNVDSPSPRSGRVLCRQYYTELAHDLHPDLPPQSSFDILVLATNKLEKQSAARKRAWIDQQWQQMIAVCGSVEAAQAGVDKFLDSMIEPTGRQPGINDPDVLYFPIPGSNLALRLWPGSLSAAEYCLSFVEANTQKPINVPEEYELWAIPDPKRPWLQPVCMALTSLEKAFGIKSEDILPGEEKFVLRDGMHCQLCRGDKKIMRFVVPERQQANAPDEEDIPLVTPQRFLA
ncbi:hypothetical protein BN946_scf184656.g16 [Trametes cinnabarina]|uniref:Uncharacterized protein n=1 Tax=Pycnoporus cinnabarinus TaxID=5643 RepID=A0A060S8L7_PYCCI|nr:hypothetical protein BN946_scf184656.g16 [Trametes cinnabarina]